MNQEDIKPLINLRDKYIKALELKEWEYCREHNLHSGLCLAFINNGCGPCTNLLYNLADQGIIKTSSGYGNYFWPTYYHHDASFEEALIPRIEALNIMIDHLTKYI